jgi:hypothetical protein
VVKVPMMVLRSAQRSSDVITRHRSKHTTTTAVAALPLIWFASDIDVVIVIVIDVVCFCRRRKMIPNPMFVNRFVCFSIFNLNIDLGSK